MTENKIKAGVGVFVLRDGKFLVGLRKGSHGAGQWALPGGHVEFGEHFYDTAVREVMEETGMKVVNPRFGAATNTFHPDASDTQYISIWVLTDWSDGEPQILEPEKCDELRWVGFESIPRPLFGMWDEFFESEFYKPVKRAVEGSKVQKV